MEILEITDLKDMLKKTEKLYENRPAYKIRENTQKYKIITHKELREMVKTIRNIEKALGNGVKTLSESEKYNLPIARKSIVAACAIKKGDFYTEQNITTKRPGNGISPVKWEQVIGKIANRDYKEDEMIENE